MNDFLFFLLAVILSQDLVHVRKYLVYCYYLYYFLNRVSEASQTFCCAFYITKANNSHEIIYRKHLNVALIPSSLSPVKCLSLVKRTWYVISRERNQRLRWILCNFPHKRLAMNLKISRRGCICELRKYKLLVFSWFGYVYLCSRAMTALAENFTWL